MPTVLILIREPNLNPVFDAGVIYESVMHARDPHGILKKISRKGQVLLGVAFPINSKQFRYPFHGYVYLKTRGICYQSVITEVVSFDRPNIPEEKELLLLLYNTNIIKVDSLYKYVTNEIVPSNRNLNQLEKKFLKEEIEQILEPEYKINMNAEGVAIKEN